MAKQYPIDIHELADAIAKSNYFSEVRTREQAYVYIMVADALDINLIDALRGVRVKRGKNGTNLELAAALIASSIRRSAKYDYAVQVATAEECAIDIVERATGKVLGQGRFTIAEAVDAKLTDRGKAGDKDYSVWKLYPSDMLFARAISRGARRYCPDLFGGAVYSTGELPDTPEDAKRPLQAAAREETPGHGASTQEALQVEIGAAFDAGAPPPGEDVPPQTAGTTAESPAPQTTEEKAATFVAEFRAKKFPDAQILLVGDRQAPEIRDAIRAILTPVEPPRPFDATQGKRQERQEERQGSGNAAEPAAAAPPAEEKDHIVALRRVCKLYNLGEANQIRWLQHFKVARIEDLTENQVMNIIIQADKLYGKKGEEAK